MLKRPLLTIALALVLAGAFCFGLARLFALRYQAGEVYPPYSTLRADPLGAKAIHDALRELPGVEVRRNFLPLKKLQPGQPMAPRLDRDRFEFHARAAKKLFAANFKPAEVRVHEADDHAANASIFDQKVRPAPQYRGCQLVLRAEAQDRSQIFLGSRFGIEVGATSYAKSSPPGQRFILLEDRIAGELRGQPGIELFFGFHGLLTQSPGEFMRYHGYITRS